MRDRVGDKGPLSLNRSFLISLSIYLFSLSLSYVRNLSLSLFLSLSFSFSLSFFLSFPLYLSQLFSCNLSLSFFSLSLYMLSQPVNIFVGRVAYHPCWSIVEYPRCAQEARTFQWQKRHSLHHALDRMVQ